MVEQEELQVLATLLSILNFWGGIVLDNGEQDVAWSRMSKVRVTFARVKKFREV